MSKTPDKVDKADQLGTLIVVLLKARNLNDKHSFRKQDVFAQAVLNGVQKRTEVDIKGGQHPVWDGECRFTVLKGNTPKNRKLEVACYAKEPREDDLLGKGTVDISETLRTGEFDDWVSLEIDGVARGDLYLEMTYYANAPAPVAAAPSNKLLSAVQGNALNRRPSKLSPSDRLSRPGQQQQPIGPSRFSPGQPSRQNDQQRLQQHPQSNVLQAGPTPHYSPKRNNDPLPAVPSDVSPYGSAHSGGGSSYFPPPTTLVPGSGAGRPLPQGQGELQSQPQPAVLPSILRPGPGGTPPTSSSIPIHRPQEQGHIRHPSASPPSSNSRLSYGSNSASAPNPYLGDGSTLAPGPIPGPGPGRAYSPAPPAANQTPFSGYGAPQTPVNSGPPPLWRSDNTSVGGGAGPQGFSFPMPVTSPVRESFGYNDPSSYSRPGLGPSGPSPGSSYYQARPVLGPSHRPTNSRDGDFDPYRQARYQTPLPLPPGAEKDNLPPRPAPADPAPIPYAASSAPLKTSLPAPDTGRIEALRRAEKEAAWRREQELKDLELAMQLDRELNLAEASAASSAAPARTGPMPGGW